MNEPTTETVEALAQWIHQAANRAMILGQESPWIEHRHWADLHEAGRGTYRGVARELLTNPPPGLALADGPESKRP